MALSWVKISGKKPEQGVHKPIPPYGSLKRSTELSAGQSWWWPEFVHQKKVTSSLVTEVCVIFVSLIP